MVVNNVKYTTLYRQANKAFNKQEKVNNVISMLMIISWEQNLSLKNVRTPVIFVVNFLLFGSLFMSVQNISGFFASTIESFGTGVHFEIPNILIFSASRNWT